MTSKNENRFFVIMNSFIRSLLLIGLMLMTPNLWAQEMDSPSEPTTKSIVVEGVTSDKKIKQRIDEILSALGTFEQVSVKVRSGVVILSGQIEEERQSQWVQDLAERIDGVVAVQNRLTAKSKKLFDINPAKKEVDRLNSLFMGYLPTFILTLLVFLLAIFLFRLSSMGLRKLLKKHIESPLLLNASVKILSTPVFLVGLYLVLRISGLTGLALTLLGGTGIFGLAMGLGLKSVFENYAASIFLSIKKPFLPSDWVKIGEFEGVVQQVNSRSTLIMEFTGNHILIPNSFVYSSIITNKSANPKMRCDFIVGIDYGDSIESAQTLILDLLAQTEFVLKDPEPWVLVDELAGSSVNLKVYYWVNVRELSVFKASSYIMLEVKKRLLANGFRMPDPNREVVFLNPLKMSQTVETEVKSPVNDLALKSPDISTMKSETAELNQQANESNLPDQGKDLLK